MLDMRVKHCDTNGGTLCPDFFLPFSGSGERAAEDDEDDVDMLVSASVGWALKVRCMCLLAGDACNDDTFSSAKVFDRDCSCIAD